MALFYDSISKEADKGQTKDVSANLVIHHALTERLWMILDIRVCTCMLSVFESTWTSKSDLSQLIKSENRLLNRCRHAVWADILFSRTRECKERHFLVEFKFASIVIFSEMSNSEPGSSLLFESLTTHRCQVVLEGFISYLVWLSSPLCQRIDNINIVRTEGSELRNTSQDLTEIITSRANL